MYDFPAAKCLLCTAVIHGESARNKMDLSTVERQGALPSLQLQSHSKEFPSESSRSSGSTVNVSASSSTDPLSRPICRSPKKGVGMKFKNASPE